MRLSEEEPSSSSEVVPSSSSSEPFVPDFYCVYDNGTCIGMKIGGEYCPTHSCGGLFRDEFSKVVCEAIEFTIINSLADVICAAQGKAK